MENGVLTIVRQSTVIPYQVEIARGDDFFCAYIPLLGRDLFHAYGDSEESAIEVLEQSFPDLVDWHLSNLGDLPPPEFGDTVADPNEEARSQLARASVYYECECPSWTQVHITTS